MNRTEFMGQLERLLWDLPVSERQDALEYYNDYFDDAGRENEDSVIQKLGSPGKVAAIIRAGYMSGPERRDSGEYTENGYRNTDDTWGRQMPVRRGREEPERAGGRSEQDREGAKRESAAGPHGSEYAGSRTASQDGGPGARQQGGAGTAAQDNGPDARRQGGAGAASQDNGPGAHQQGGTGAGGAGNADAGRYGPSAGMQRPACRRRGVGGWVLLVIAAIFLFPVLTGIGGGLLGVFAGLFGAVVALVFSGVGLVAGGIAAGVEGVSISFTAPASGLVVLGSGFLLVSVGLLMILFFGWLLFCILPRAVRGLVNWVSRLLHHGRGAERQGGEQR